MVPPFGKLDPPCLQVVWSEELQELEMVLVCLEMGSAELVPGALGSWQLAVGSFTFFVWNNHCSTMVDMVV